MPARSPALTDEHVRQRLEFAIRYRHWTFDQWKLVVFSDEKIFRGSGHGARRVWRPESSRYDAGYLRRRNRNDPHKVNVWGCICGSGGADHLHRIAQKTLDADYYVRNILSAYVPRGSEDDPFYFVHDRASQHTAAITRRFLENRNVRVLPWPPKAADMNPIENVWAEMERRMAFRRPDDENRLWELVRDTFRSLEDGYVRSLVESMPRRLQGVIDAEGQWTRY